MTNNINTNELFNIRPIINVSKKIALVGNSDSLLNKDYSQEIDSYQDVIRFNFSNILPKFTGSKTTIRWINCPIDIHSAKQHNQTLISDLLFNQYVKKLFIGPKVIAWDSIKDKLLLYSNKIQVHKPNGLCTNKNINDYLDTLSNITTRFDTSINSWPRTGFQAVLTCIKSGCIPHLYGFDITERNVIYHYSKTQKYIVDNITEHQVKTEVNILRELRDNNYVVIHI